MTITVLVPTYCRPQTLARCLEALKQQTRPADEILIVVRTSDEKTWRLLEGSAHSPLVLRTLTVEIPGVVAALNVGLNAAHGEIIAITDDDAAPRPDWLALIEEHFLRDPKVGGVGGRDWVHHGEGVIDFPRAVVGKIRWFGKIVGNHHLGVGEPRAVDVLKGANMSYRREAIHGIRFDERLQGSGAQVHHELAFGLAVKREGWTLIYDPAVAVDHYPAQRFDADQRGEFSSSAIIDAAHNETLILLEHIPAFQRAVFVAWAILIGTRAAPGFVQLLRFLPTQGRLAGRKWLATLQGRWNGYRTWQRHR